MKFWQKDVVDKQRDIIMINGGEYCSRSPVKTHLENVLFP